MTGSAAACLKLQCITIATFSSLCITCVNNDDNAGGLKAGVIKEACETIRTFLTFFNVFFSKSPAPLIRLAKYGALQIVICICIVWLFTFFESLHTFSRTLVPMGTGRLFYAHEAVTDWNARSPKVDRWVIEWSRQWVVAMLQWGNVGDETSRRRPWTSALRRMLFSRIAKHLSWPPTGQFQWQEIIQIWDGIAIVCCRKSTCVAGTLSRSSLYLPSAKLLISYCLLAGV